MNCVYVATKAGRCLISNFSQELLTCCSDALFFIGDKAQFAYKLYLAFDPCAKTICLEQSVRTVRATKNSPDLFPKPCIIKPNVVIQRCRGQQNQRNDVASFGTFSGFCTQTGALPYTP